MATYFFHEERSTNEADGAITIIRYYYDDINADIHTRTHRFFPAAVQNEFLGNGNFPLADASPTVKAALLACWERRAQGEPRRAGS